MTMSAEQKESIAQEKFGVSYDELDSSQKQSVGGSAGGKASGKTGGETEEMAAPAPSSAAEASVYEHKSMTDDDKERIAQEKFQTSYASLDTNQQKAVGGFFRAEGMGSEGYSAMGKLQNTKE